MPTDSLFFGEEEQKQIIAAIKEAEKQTSGEVKVHIEKKCSSSDVLERAKEVFGLLGMHATSEQNGVLFYLAYEDRKFAVLGDKGINEKVPSDFWNSTKDLLRSYFSQSKYSEGLCAGIKEAGLQLKTHFPYRSDDVNELPDDISFG
ncbi:TLP18.3, Psb32 and MOLO-1 founding protein of phosphatase [Dyadobacter koreensis]|uniref:TLP18.3, Psb32 and MOLO-1 founding protein of phosphatase n=1 Tax=Dyadobacter koreensis TaxID=408657 RepID=A0A1H7AD34_9BACT|nr:TPM domain-containing protein [Dyadobacter koreensis]SEJ62846.1 TLP18.3, Psb32 and MOLO-1 founding protein of phosphatase [Dyadobacter koreensis]